MWLAVYRILCASQFPVDNVYYPGSPHVMLEFLTRNNDVAGAVSLHSSKWLRYRVH